MYVRTMSKIQIGGHYTHYKQKSYKVIGLAIHSETLEELVIYEALYENPLGQVWARPTKICLESIETPTYKGPRFQLKAKF